MSDQDNNCKDVEITKNNFTFDKTIAKYANEVGVDPNLIKAVVNTESHFKKEKKGKAGEYGLMQVREIAAKDVWKNTEEFNEKWKKVEIFDVDASIECGTKYLKMMLENNKNSVARALAAYNGGQTNLNSWLAKNGNDFKGNFDKLDAGIKNHLHKVECARKWYYEKEDSEAFGECHWVTIDGNNVCIKNK